MKKWIRRLVVLAALVVLLYAALNLRLTVQYYTVKSDAVDAPIRLALLNDLHGLDPGEEFIGILTEQHPDAFLLAGDMFSADGDPAEELALFRQLVDIAPTFYVTGNHEYWEQDIPALYDQIAAAGVTVLNQTCVQLTVRGQCINLCGIPDPNSGIPTEQALREAAEGRMEGFTVLLTHRPELVEQYAAAGCFDLVLAGHTHGGQVRIPGLINGFYAPNQGWFPKYVGGEYQVDNLTMIVSRGLCTKMKWVVPRIFNPREIVIVTIE